MRRRVLTTAGAGITRSAAACVLVATGVVGASLGVLFASPLSPPATARELTPFDDCAELRQWYVDAALPHVTAWGLGWPGFYGTPAGLEMRTAVPLATDASADAAVGSGGTGTNVQEAGVDEPDVAKTDGGLVVHVHGQELLLTDTSGAETRELSRLTLPRRLQQPELLLVGDRLVVFGTPSHRWFPAAGVVDTRIVPGTGTRAETRVLTVDVSDALSPHIVSDHTVDGAMVSARQYGDTVRLVTSTGAPRLPFVHPGGGLSRQEATAENRRLVRESTVGDWLPAVRSEVGREPLLACSEVHHPDRSSGFGTISVLTFDPKTPEDRSATAVTTDGDLVYSSTERLYVATRAGGWWEPIPLTTPDGRPAVDEPTTEVHAFALDADSTEYLASGEVSGTVRDRWSFSEHDGRLRVATALGADFWSPRENGIAVLEERAGSLVEVGSVDAMGIDEQIQSVRWMGDTAVVVTFRQVDPLYTVDLSDPERPIVVGELKIPGFSSYLHPIGGGLLLGLGQDATMRGQTRGAQAAVFDLSDLSTPARLDTDALRAHTEFLAAADPRAFTYLPDERVALAPVHSYWTGNIRLEILRIGEDGSIARRSMPLTDGWRAQAVRTLPLDDGRVAVVVGSAVTTLAP